MTIATPTDSTLAPAPAGLAALEARLRQDLQWLGLPARRWVPPRLTEAGEPVLDVAIVGGGMAGLALGASLAHMGVQAPLFDRAPEGFEGPWATTARMETLRSPKELTGPALGLPALTFRAWFESQFGLPAWAALDKIPRLQWMDYLRWYRRVLGLDVRNRQRVLAVHPRADGLVRIDLADDANGGAPHHVLARHAVLATGRDGLGGPWVPDWARALPAGRWAHSADVWDGAALRGLRVAVVGGGASAMDSAATALEAGAARVDLLVRRAELPRVNKGKGAGNPGMAHGFWSLPDEWKWRFRHYLNVQQVPPPHGSTLRVSRHANAHFHLGAGVHGASVRPDGALRLETAKGPLAADFVVFCTGFRTDWALRPEFAAFAPAVRLWQDRFVPPAGEDDAELAASPDLGPLFEFQEKAPGACPGLDRVHCFNYGGALSQGAGAGDIPQISDGAQRLARGLAARLLADDAALHYAAMQRYEEPELDGDEWTPAAFSAYGPEGASPAASAPALPESVPEVTR
ncbi:NAD(P)/FAD-dependent oxidoreductase [Acidovorax sp. SUPP1855]|uniref:flavin-containing monooxygenase n=1 Tax=Acidovorax sp. SUPP1855 TaxID=431774 RepID=UPI0023DE3204|nr:NAD(P)/FAD-dependent oxidoreductase [Acidovorax sp. SUPP1855]GKS85910.1 NAD(P)/FAD-dependent oxidoreductase [Acidovorax sp. SUPP1855]